MKKIVSTISLLSLAQFAFAIEEKDSFNVKIGGDVEAQFGNISQKSEFNKVEKSGERQKSALTTSGSLKFTIDKKNLNGIDYGALLKLNANPSKTKGGKDQIADELKIYIQGNFGKLELGSTKPVGDSMQVNSYTGARATGGIDGDWGTWLNNESGIMQGDNELKVSSFYTAAELPETSKANKINYYTPNFNGLSFGISYTPDTKAKGTVDNAKGILANSAEDGYKNVIQPAVRYETNLSDNVKLTSAVLGVFGKAKDHLCEDKETCTNIAPTPRKDLRAWQVGLGLSYKDISISGAYGDLGQSGAAKDRAILPNNNKYGGQYWSIGSVYGIDKYGISINYMESKRAGFVSGKTKDEITELSKNNSEYNKFSAISIGADYQVMPGLLPYIEVTRFNFKGNNNFNRNGNDAKFNKGTVFLAGTKIKF